MCCCVFGSEAKYPVKTDMDCVLDIRANFKRIPDCKDEGVLVKLLKNIDSLEADCKTSTNYYKDESLSLLSKMKKMTSNRLKNIPIENAIETHTQRLIELDSTENIYRLDNTQKQATEDLKAIREQLAKTKEKIAKTSCLLNESKKSSQNADKVYTELDRLYSNKLSKNSDHSDHILNDLEGRIKTSLEIGKQEKGEIIRLEEKRSYLTIRKKLLEENLELLTKIINKVESVKSIIKNLSLETAERELKKNKKYLKFLPSSIEYFGKEKIVEESARFIKKYNEQIRSLQIEMRKCRQEMAKQGDFSLQSTKIQKRNLPKITVDYDSDSTIELNEMSDSKNLLEYSIQRRELGRLEAIKKLADENLATLMEILHSIQTIETKGDIGIAKNIDIAIALVQKTQKSMAEPIKPELRSRSFEVISDSYIYHDSQNRVTAKKIIHYQCELDRSKNNLEESDRVLEKLTTEFEQAINAIDNSVSDTRLEELNERIGTVLDEKLTHYRNKILFEEKLKGYKNLQPLLVEYLSLLKTQETLLRVGEGIESD